MNPTFTYDHSRHYEQREMSLMSQGDNRIEMMLDNLDTEDLKACLCRSVASIFPLITYEWWIIYVLLIMRFIAN